MTDHTFSDLPTLLCSGDLLVVNRTRVRHGRLTGVRADSGGNVELLLLRPKEGKRWEALIRPARRMRRGVSLQLGPISAQLASEPVAGLVDVDLDVEGDVEDVIAQVGATPLPPYFHGSLPDPERYQTMFAAVTGSAAAPTAALHFTPRLVDRLAAMGVVLGEVELEVGLDTFRPMSENERLQDHTMHSERYAITAEVTAAIAATRERAGRVVAVGTTVMRTLETAAVGGGQVAAGKGASSLFITPGYQPRVVDALVTNFHAPRTTLMVLVAALLGPGWREVYTTALARGYRFLSFGDAMLIESLRGDIP